MRLVEEISDILDNIMVLERYRNSDDLRERDFYLSLINKGICFVVYKHKGEFLFGPSRFVGYIDNNRSEHLRNKSKDGRKTNKAIKQILGDAPIHYESLEIEYRRLCESLNIECGEKGTYGVGRKYWFIERT